MTEQKLFGFIVRVSAFFLALYSIYCLIWCVATAFSAGASLATLNEGAVFVWLSEAIGSIALLRWTDPLVRFSYGSPGNPGKCARCGYDLRGSPGRCPECGTSS